MATRSTNPCWHALTYSIVAISKRTRLTGEKPRLWKEPTTLCAEAFLTWDANFGHLLAHITGYKPGFIGSPTNGIKGRPRNMPNTQTEKIPFHPQIKRIPGILISLTLLLLLKALPLQAQTNVLTQRYDNSRSGVNSNERVLSQANVNAKNFGKLFTRYVDGEIYAQPLVVSNLGVPGRGKRNVVFIATEHNSVYAFDGDNPDAVSPFFRQLMWETLVVFTKISVKKLA
jgi:hypothetical protein